MFELGAGHEDLPIVCTILLVLAMYVDYLRSFCCCVRVCFSSRLQDCKVAKTITNSFATIQ